MLQAVNKHGQIVTLRGGGMCAWGHRFLESLVGYDYRNGHDQSKLAELIKWMNSDVGFSPEYYWSFACKGQWDKIMAMFRQLMVPKMFARLCTGDTGGF